MEVVDYRRHEPNVSDHRPVSAVYKVKVKTIHPVLCEQEKTAVVQLWRVKSAALLKESQTFYLGLFGVVG